MSAWSDAVVVDVGRKGWIHWRQEDQLIASLVSTATEKKLSKDFESNEGVEKCQDLESTNGR